MKRHFILGIMALAALASCNKSEVLNKESLEEQGIKFSVYVGKTTQSKATTISATNAAAAGIGVLSWRTGSTDVTNDYLAANAPTFMSNIRLTLGELATSGNYTVTYSPVRYWSSEGLKASFYAYAPYATGTAALPDGTTADNNTYHPENITFNKDQGGAHILTLNVPKGNADVAVYKSDEDEKAQTNSFMINSGDVYNTQTDFMVSRVGNGDNNTGNVTTQEGTTQLVGINQNLTKEDDKVVLNMRHALSKISFEVKAGNQNTPYQDVKVVFDHINVKGSFVNGGTYNLFTEKWETLTGADTLYGFRNTYGDNAAETDPFNPIADEVYNVQLADGATADETNTPNTDGWYKLNKSSHDLMVVPFAEIPATGDAVPAQITSISGKYIVQTFETRQKKDGEGNLMFEADGTTPIMETVEIPIYRDNVYFSTNFEGTPIDLQAGKSYIFRFNIELKKIEFEVALEEWEESTYNVL